MLNVTPSHRPRWECIPSTPYNSNPTYSKVGFLLQPTQASQTLNITKKDLLLSFYQIFIYNVLTWHLQLDTIT
jgi:hypothetical protein